MSLLATKWTRHLIFKSPIPKDSDETELRQSYTMPISREDGAKPVDIVMRTAKSEGAPTTTLHRLDRFGFILNMDAHGSIIRDTYVSSGTAPALPTLFEHERNERRVKKWDSMMAVWETRRQKKLVSRRLRKGIPDSVRGKAWVLMTGAGQKMEAHPGFYDDLVRRTLSPSGTPKHAKGKETDNGTAAITTLSHSTSFLSLQETIERDIHRTFPRHTLFYDLDDEIVNPPLALDVCGVEAISNLIREGERKESSLSSRSILENIGGQASLRRVLKAYSLYDQEIGYCQGMNFIGTLLY
jgi:hypothetical protein